MKNNLLNRLLGVILAAVMVLGFFPSASAAPVGLYWEKSDIEVSWNRNDRLIPDEIHGMADHMPADQIRVSIILEDTPTLEAGYSTQNIGSNQNAKAYDRALQKVQEDLADRISVQALGGKELDVVWNLTLVSNIISANVPYSKIDAVRAVEGVRDVVIENSYEVNTGEQVVPNMHSAAGMEGATTVWQSGLTGAGSRVAIIDTGTDTDHQSFDNGAYLYALQQNAEAKGMTPENYKESLNLLDTADIAGVLTELNAYERIRASAAQFYLSEKLPFAANYSDRNLNVTHDNDGWGSHGSHVAGIAAANRFVPKGDSYVDARQTVQMNGVAPDAQIITMKIFGNGPAPMNPISSPPSKTRFGWAATVSICPWAPVRPATVTAAHFLI